jgi:hypothetical protein
MKKLLTILVITIALLPLCVHLTIGSSNIISTYQNWAMNQLTASSAATASSASSTHEVCPVETMGLMIVGALLILGLLYFIRVHPLAMKLSTAFCVALVVEALLYWIEPAITRFVGPSSAFAVNAASMVGIVPLHHYLESRFLDYMMAHPALPAVRELVRTIFRF